MYSDPNSLRLSLSHPTSLFAQTTGHLKAMPADTAAMPSVPPAEPATQPSFERRQAAAVTIQSIYRGRRAMAQLCRQHRAMDTYLRAHGGNAYLPALAAAVAPRIKRKRDHDACSAPDLPPADQMNAEQRLRHLKQLHPELFRQVLAEVDNKHTQVLQRLGEQPSTPSRLRTLRRQVSDEIFVARLPADACDKAGFFSPQKLRFRLCHRDFVAPAQDVQMDQA